MITVVWLYNKFMALKASGKSDEELLQTMEETILAYDNMCHLDSLRISRKDLPLPFPFKKMWQKVGKVIDRLHLQNHKDPLCKVKYNPDNSLPEGFNTMAAEPVNVWVSRLKRIMVSMPYMHHMFFFHQMVKKKKCLYGILLRSWKTTCLYLAEKTTAINVNYRIVQCVYG